MSVGTPLAVALGWAAASIGMPGGASSMSVANLIVLAGLLLMPRMGGAFLELFLRNSGIIAGIIFFANLLPLPRAGDGFATDGRQIVDVLRAGI